MVWSLVCRAREARQRRLVVGCVVLGIVVGLSIGLRMRATSPCESAVRNGEWRRGVDICLESYKRTGQPSDLVWAAKAYMYLGDLAHAGELAQQALAGTRYADAHQVLSYLALRQGHAGTAVTHATVALGAHAYASDLAGQTNDAVLLAQAQWRLGEFASALTAADMALTLARKLGDPRREVAADLARADALCRLGDTRGAADTLTHAIERATDPCDKAWAHLKNGRCQVQAGEEGLALSQFDLAERANGRCGSREISRSVALTEAWLLRSRDPLGARAKLDGLTADEIETLVLRGYLAADRGALAEADGYLSRAARLDPPNADWPLEIACARADLSEQRGGWLGDLLAVHHYRRAIAMVAALRASARARSAYVVASRREPYDGLIALFARHGWWHAALSVVLDLDASDMLRATASEARLRDRTDQDVDAPDPGTVTMPQPAVDDVLTAWRSRDLVIIIAQSPREIGGGHERVFRMTITDGRITGEDVGDASTARTWADRLFADPGDRDAARALGHMIVPPDRTDRTLHVLAIGSLGKVPLAALRDDDGALIVGKRPLVRVLALRATRPEASGAGPSVVIADPRGDLPAAAIEGAVVAKALGPEAQLSGSGTSSPATRDRLWAARDAGLLHVAGHVGELGRWRTLHLADGDVAPAEIVQRGLAPRIAVLAGCGSAAALDEEGWGSIAAALLESGTAVVIATDRSVGDAAALSVMRDFYAQLDWRTDPARALARVQQALDARVISSDPATKARSWAAFSILARPPTVPARSAADRQK